MQKNRQSLIRENLQTRSRIIQAFRGFFLDSGYLEIETPHRIPAPAPEANIDALESESWFLHTSPELCMKRLLSAGYPRIFQICRCFRNNERGDKHLPEFTILEWYSAGSNYTDLMAECEGLVRYAAEAVGAGQELAYQGERVDLTGPWPRMTVSEAFDRFASISMADALCRDSYDEAMGLEIEPHLGRGRPVFLQDYPVSRGALARRRPENDLLVERFELYICGLELCNGFSELSDPGEQRSRFEHENETRKRSGVATCPMPERFLRDLESMPNAAGNALGVDRLVMLFTDTAKIDDVVAFTPEEL